MHLEVMWLCAASGLLCQNPWGTKRPYLEHKHVTFTLYKSISLRDKFVDKIFKQIFRIEGWWEIFVFWWGNLWFLSTLDTIWIKFRQKNLIVTFILCNRTQKDIQKDIQTDIQIWGMMGNFCVLVGKFVVPEHPRVHLN